ncbi:hypothetical protein MPTK1_3g03980 [Marchantia polymorpha subsp. ruderalis]|uniref:VOC domain-containing protein n=2 Tax=Marchantia polymorpha TaxID=3197 RepID=A0A176WJK7_MARPO|nr:hypothetical protein AXG93_3242s1450 [Marchantia polymorpha subsp. ruderalis]PTQ44038.1 hypothetical protein MARPO_0022s0133 [Marchantia polymorpha]BBN04366.1 hypothetical protein Mp_3g03980 [Marchantia polymorpha subsp. ruderalis]|eukprot:PTQ44038.1 hypothetical protein MARPO_0022s0133 [Marchantia polymorpha]
MELVEPTVDGGGNIQPVSMNQMAHTNLSRLRKASALPLSCINHISRKCSNLPESQRFYEDLLGFVQVKRPGSLAVSGVWLFNYGIGIHLLQSMALPGSAQRKELNPNDDHLSFQCEDIDRVERMLRANGVQFLRREIEEDGIMIDQLFFHDPDCFMIEVCNCDQLPLVPLARSASLKNQHHFFSACKRTMGLINAASTFTAAHTPSPPTDQTLNQT